MEPTKPNYFSNFIKVLVPQLVSAFIKKALTGLGGFKFLIVKYILQYGGKELIYWVNEQLRQHEREAEQKKAKEEKDNVVNDPNSTPDQIGETYEDYFNSGRNPKP